MTDILSTALGAVKTGEAAPWLLAFFLILLLSSIACIVFLTLTRKK